MSDYADLMFPTHIYSRTLSGYTTVHVQQTGEFGRYVEVDNTLVGSRTYSIIHSPSPDSDKWASARRDDVRVNYVDNLDTGTLTLTFKNLDYGDENLQVTTSWEMVGKDHRAIWEEAHHYLTNVPVIATV